MTVIRVSGSLYALPLGPNDNAKELLHHLPGVRHNATLNRLEGPIDGLAVACLRLGRSLPSLPPAQSTGVARDGVILRDYQVAGVDWLVSKLKHDGGALLADDMGLGKSLQALLAAKELTRGGGRILVTCPAFLRENWRQELLKWGETDVAALVPMNKTKKVQADWEKAQTAKWVITSYDLAPKALPFAFKTAAPRMLIMDEAHYLKGRHAKRTASLQQISVLAPYKLALTGTPIWSRPRDFYKLLSLLFGNRFGSSYDFDIAYAGAFINDFGGLDNRGCSNSDELKARVNLHMLRRLKADVAKDLPSLTRQVIWLDPIPKASAAFHEALSARTNSATHRALEATLECKMEAAMNAAAQAKRFLLFTWRKDHAHEMARILEEELDTPCLVVTGDLPADKRKAVVDDASRRGIGVVATIDSLGAGINAQGLGYIGIFHALDYVPAKMAQAEARLHRIGQTSGVVWQFLAVRESYDEIVINTILDKLDATHAVLGGDLEMRNAFGDGSAKTEEEQLRELYEGFSGT